MLRRFKVWRRCCALVRVHRANVRRRRYLHRQAVALQEAAREGVRPGESWDEFVYRIECMTAR